MFDFEFRILPLDLVPVFDTFLEVLGILKAVPPLDLSVIAEPSFLGTVKSP